MPLKIALLVVTFVAAGCGGCGGGTTNNGGGPPCDGSCPLPSAQVAWDHAVLSAPHAEIDLCGAVVLPTGIAILAPPKYILLADKTDGHLIAKAPWPTGVNNFPSDCGAAIARKSGDLAILMDDYPTSAGQMAVHEYKGSDLSQIKPVDVSTQPGFVELGELNALLYVLERSSAPALSFYSVTDGGVNAQNLATGLSAPIVYGGALAKTPGGALLTCATFPGAGPPAVLRITPPGTMTKTLSFAGGTGANDCRLIAGPDRDLVTWEIAAEKGGHWDMISRDGTKLIAKTAGQPRGMDSIAYGNGVFASVKGTTSTFIKLYVTDPDTAAVRGPYAIAVGSDGIGKPAIAGDSQNLWVAYDLYLDSIHLVKLGPLPK